ncbi:hypothetical protein Dimus_018877 [Dionaea muscipula]
MSTASSPSDPNASDDLPNAASLAITILPPPETSSDPALNIPLSSNASPNGIRRIETTTARVATWSSMSLGGRRSEQALMQLKVEDEEDGGKRNVGLK